MLTRGREGRRFIPSAAFCERKLHEAKVQSDMAVTPSDIERLAKQGIPVSVPNANQFLPADPEEGWNVPTEFQSDMDRNTAWELEQGARAKVMNAHKREKQLYG